jgi:hypothetical protein
MPKYHDLIADSYTTDTVSNNILVNDLFNKYSPCNGKFIAMTRTKQYIGYKLNKAIRAVKYEGKSLDNAIDEKMVADVWSALCPLVNTKQFKIKVPDTLQMELEKMVGLKTQSFNKSLKKKQTLKLKEQESNSESEEKSESEEESESEKKTLKSNKKVITNSTKKLTNLNTKSSKKVNKKIQKKSESESSNSDSESDSE